MKKLLAGVCFLCMSLWVHGQSVTEIENGFRIYSELETVEVTFFSPSVVRIVKYPKGNTFDKQSLSVVKQPEKVRVKWRFDKGKTALSSSQLVVLWDENRRALTFKNKKGEQLLAEKADAVRFVPMQDAGQPSYRVSQSFVLEDGEAVYGLGQHQQGGLNQRGREVFLQQVNMEIGIPIVHSNKGYAVFWDNYSTTTYKDDKEGMSFTSEVGDGCDYYFIYGGHADGVIAGLRDLTGRAPLSPLWSYGFIQSKERYASQDELVGVVRKYRDLQIPLDGIVLDWRYWGDDHHWWNAVEFLRPEFSNPRKMIDDVHTMNAHAMVSIWPSFGPNTNIYRELKEKNLLMKHETFPQDHGVRVYDAYHPEARKVYWDYIRKNMYDIGMDSYWLDATEPEHNPIKDEDYDYRTYSGSFRKMRNAFPLVSVGGVYDHHRQLTDRKRVLILTRSAFAGQQRYGAHSWSGDVIADWTVFRNQIPAALNFSLCGIPYWNSDIGAFWTWQNFPDGYKDPAYRKFYVRWMQFAVFTGMMRSHGSNTPREIFNFGQRGDWAFDVQERFINLRYRLLPYIYSNAWQITSENATLMRALFMDYPNDKKVLDLDDEFLFGKSFLIAPVTTPDDKRNVYLPVGTWIDFWTGESVTGGCTLNRQVPIDQVPVYVKAGTVLPIGPTVQYVREKVWDDLQIRIYPGADGEFVLYEDAGDTYDYEKGAYTTVRFTWDETRKELTIHPREGEFPGMLEKRSFRIVKVDTRSGLGLDNVSAGKTVNYVGKKLKINLE